MAYTVLRVRLSGFRDRFKDFNGDTDFEVQSYPELDEFLCTMEERGWSVVNTAAGTASNGVTFVLYITLHQPEAAASEA